MRPLLLSTLAGAILFGTCAFIILYGLVPSWMLPESWTQNSGKPLLVWFLVLIPGGILRGVAQKLGYIIGLCSLQPLNMESSVPYAVVANSVLGAILFGVVAVLYQALKDIISRCYRGRS